MANITVRNQGNVSDEGQVNWRGDQVAVTPGDQSIFDSSTVQLAAIGTRKVVGDRVFRYSQSGAAPVGIPGNIMQSNYQLISATAGGGTAPSQSGGKTFIFYFATSTPANAYAEGYIMCQSGTSSNQGQCYKVKSHPAVATTSTGLLTLYEPLVLNANTGDTWTLIDNPYSNLTINTAGTAASAGVCPIAVTTNDFFWLQTWGPCCVKAGVAVNTGISVGAGNTGQTAGITVITGTVPNSIGYTLQMHTASQYGMIFLQIAP